VGHVAELRCVSTAVHGGTPPRICCHKGYRVGSKWFAECIQCRAHVAFFFEYEHFCRAKVGAPRRLRPDECDATAT
jgi:hypothetical protein